MAIFRRMPRRTGTGKIQRVVLAAAIQQDRPESIDQGGSWSRPGGRNKCTGDGSMQDKAIGIAVFALVAVLMGFLAFQGAAGEGYDFMGGIKQALSDPGSWATAITALAVAGMAMGVYTNGGLSGANIKNTVLLLAVAGLVGGDIAWGGDGAAGWGVWVGLAWLITGGIRV